MHTLEITFYKDSPGEMLVTMGGAFDEAYWFKTPEEIGNNVRMYLEEYSPELGGKGKS